MSEAESQNLNILLPDATVAVYSRDNGTLEAARDVMNDWRFARVKVEAFEGDVNSAAETYKDALSPDLVIVQTDTIDDSLPASLESLAASCEESTAAIVIGPVNDVYLYRKLIDMGVSDYLVRPVETRILCDVIAKTLVERKGVTGSRLIAIIGAKGGVGSTALAAASAWGSAEIMGQKTALLDAAGGWSTLSVSIGFEPMTTLSSAARAAAHGDEDSLKRMLFKASDKLSALASGSDAMLGAGITEEQMESLIDTLMVKYPVVIADLSKAPPEVMRIFASRANQVMLVSLPTLSSLRMARTLLHEIRDLRGKDDKNIELVVNMQGLSPSTEVSKKEIEQAMEFKVSAAIPFAPKIFMALENESKRLTSTGEGMQIVKESILPVLRRVIDAQVPAEEDQAAKGGGFLNSLLGKIKKK